jgi:parallel beta-helix repeat protein
MCEVRCVNEENKDADKGPCPVKILLVKRSLVASFLLLSLLLLFTAGVSATDRTVCASGCDHTSIQDAVNAADPGDTIIVHNGLYIENVLVNKSLTIRSQNGSAITTVQANNSADHVFNVTADYVNISRFNVTGATSVGMSGIYLDNVTNCNISNNTASGNRNGIYLNFSSNNTIANNTANSNEINGIVILASSNSNNLTGNTANSNGIRGIFLWGSCNNNTLTGNTALNNTYGIYLDSASNNYLIGNTASDNTYGIYLESPSNNNNLIGNTASNNAYGIWLWASKNNNLIGNTASNNAYGINLRFSSNNNTLTGNTANSNTYSGIFLYNSRGNNITNNTCTYNGLATGYDGISLVVYSHSNTLMKNICSSNGADGIYLGQSINNNVTSNTCSGNLVNGIHLYLSSNNRISCNWVHHNTDHGFFLTAESTGNMIVYNNIMANGDEQPDGSWQYNFYNNQSNNVTAEDNYWGTASSAVIAASIYLDPGLVDYEPFLSAPAPCAPFEAPPKVPALTPTGIIALVSLLSAIAAVTIVRKRR